MGAMAPPSTAPVELAQPTGDVDVVPGDTRRTFENIEQFVGEIVDGGAVPFLMGGDHAIRRPFLSLLVTSNL